MMKLFRVAIFASLFFASNQQPVGVPDLELVRGCWTNWFDRDNPSGSKGDWETLTSLQTENPGKICKTPRGIEAQTLNGFRPSFTQDVIYKMDTTTGFICRNSDQKHGKICNNYRVRFSCPPPFCEVCWTQWFNRGDPIESWHLEPLPNDSGDFETLPSLRRENPGAICPSPFAIEAKTLTGLSPAAVGDVIYKMDTTTGFICRNNDQKRTICNDYRVRFSCPLSFCDVEVCWTEWFNGDNPRGVGDWKTLLRLHMVYPEKICPKPVAIEAQTLTGLSAAESGDVIYKNDPDTGFICRNDDQKEKSCHEYRVRFSCPNPFCKDKECWTKWFNRDNPRVNGDWEDLRSLREDNPGKICEKPLYIEAVTTDTNTPSTSTGDIIAFFSPTGGFICRNQDQKSGQCRDYKVRFWCPC